MAAAAVKKEEVEAGSCPLYRCFCCWRRACSPRIPRVAPGRDYLCIPAGADDSPAWSLLVGFLSDSSSIISDDSVLGLHRFRVARSGRILGQSDDALDMLHTLRTIKGCNAIASADAALTPDGRSLCLFSEHLEPGKVAAIPRVNELRVTYKYPSGRRASAETASYRRQRRRSTITMSPLPRLPADCPEKCRPVSAAGRLWAPNIKLEVRTSKCFVGMLRLDRGRERWDMAGDTFPFLLRREELTDSRWGGPLFQGYAVLHNDTILVSLRADQGLLTFNCSDCTWTKVTTTKDTHIAYTPILGRGVYIEKDVTDENGDDDDGSVYFLRGNHIFAYKLCYSQDPEDQRRKLELEPPAMIDAVCPDQRRKLEPPAMIDAVCPDQRRKLEPPAMINAVCLDQRRKLELEPPAMTDSICPDQRRKLELSAMIDAVCLDQRRKLELKPPAMIDAVCPDQRRKLELQPPAMIDAVCPFREEGYGFLTHLGGRLMCSVWISTSLCCACDYRHVLITTFRVRSKKAEQKGIDILHSTCRRLHVLPLGLPIHKFCFLQEYEDKDVVQPSMRDYPTNSPIHESCFLQDAGGALHKSRKTELKQGGALDLPKKKSKGVGRTGKKSSLDMSDAACIPRYVGVGRTDKKSTRILSRPATLHISTREYEDKDVVQPSMRDYPTSSQVIEESSKILDCCSNFLSELGYYKFEEPPEDPALQINKLLFIICKAGSQLIVHVAKIENGNLRSPDELLEKRIELNLPDDDDDYYVFEELPPWHLVFSSCSSMIYAVSNTQDDIHEYNVMKEVEEPTKGQCIKPTSDPFSMVLQVGDKIVAVSYTLHVFYHDQSKWVCCSHHANESLVPNGKANLSGYAVLDGNSFIVSDADTSTFLLFDLRSKRWSVLRRALPAAQLLNGRSIFVDGFIYTCTSRGLLAYELVQQGKNHKDLLDPIFLQFSWKFSHDRTWVAERMCLDCADKDKKSDAIVFFVIQGEYCYSKSLPGGNSTSHDVHITTVQVNTERARGGKRKPERIHHLGIGRCFIEHDAALVWTKSCFSVGF